jgi:chromosome segregation protein
VHLKSLILRGFKSFADRTVLELEPGITVVVGPNGSGKSNIVDAVAWVLGAQGARTLRGGKMDDVIFAGTPARPALGRAEVQLVIDNSTGDVQVDAAEVSITRTLYRSGESEYQLNGTPCRLLDIQELLSDTGVGRTQHVIVGQGQLDTILNSRPEDRRAVIEEAAGVLKFRRRKERAERRLEATEANLVRLQDLLREVRRQLRPLERQAEAARVHDQLAGELSVLRLHLAGRELDALGARAGALADGDDALAEREREVRVRLRELDADVTEAEARLGELADDGSADVVARVGRVRERAKGLVALVAEKRRGVERAAAAEADEGVAASLADEAARVRDRQAEVDDEAELLAPVAAEVEAAEADVARLRAETDATPQPPPPAGPGSGELRGELGAVRAALQRGRADQERIQPDLAALAARADEVEAEAARLAAERDRAQADPDALGAARATAGERRQAAEGALEAAEERLRGAQGDATRWHARADALALALDQARAATGVDRLAGVEGVAGPLVDLIEIEPGREAAAAAALGEALRAVVVDSPAAGRRALQGLAAGEASALLLVLAERVASSGQAPAGPPPAGRWAASCVRARPTAPAGLDAALDALLGGVVVVDGDAWAALDLAVAHAELTVVDAHGSTFGALWRTGGAAATATTKAALDEARERATAADGDLAAARGALDGCRAAAKAARDVEAEAERAVDALAETARRAEQGLARLDTTRSDLTRASAQLVRRAEELDAQLARDTARAAELEVRLPEVEAGERAHQHLVAARRSQRDEVARRAAAAAALRRDLEVRAAGVEERRTGLRNRLAELEARLARLGEEAVEAERRRARLTDAAARYVALEARLAAHLERVDDLHQRAQGRRASRSDAARAQAQALDELRRGRQEAERRLAEVQDQRRRVEIDRAECRMRLEAATEAVRREHDCEPEVAIATPAPELASGTNPAERARELDRDLRRMGPVNPLALEEYEALKERHEFLGGQLDDVRDGRRELQKIIDMVDTEIAEEFRRAYLDVERHFEDLFATLFPGGSGQLRLTIPDDPLTTGIEIEARPSGKVVRRLSLLSGGERALTAMAFLFAVYRARPAPFYVLDEVDAALDDVNLHRFVSLLDAFRDEAQLLVISHQKRTMETSDYLYGVSMAPGQSTKVISQRNRAVGPGATPDDRLPDDGARGADQAAR